MFSSYFYVRVLYYGNNGIKTEQFSKYIVILFMKTKLNILIKHQKNLISNFHILCQNWRKWGNQ